MIEMIHPPIHITFLYNAAVLIRCDNVSVLIDALYRQQVPGLSAPSEPVLEEILRGEGAFAHLDCLLCSHRHADHFSPELTAGYLRLHRPGLALFPRECRAALSALPPERLATAHWLFQTGSRAYPLPNGNRVTALRTTHTGTQFRDVAHYSYLLELCGRRIFLAADATGLHNDFSLLPGCREADAFVVNPLFIAHSSGRKALQALRPGALCVYHIPAKADDGGNYRSLTKYCLQRYGAEWNNPLAFWEEGQTVVI